jgi:hypothetical protein
MTFRVGFEIDLGNPAARLFSVVVFYTSLNHVFVPFPRMVPHPFEASCFVSRRVGRKSSRILLQIVFMR